MSGDPEQEYFSDGMAEDITTALSRIRSLFVIARNSAFAYKGTSPDIRKVGRELGVRYVLEGSVRKSGNRVRITVQLIEAASGTHIWADRFDGTLDDVFDLQDRVTASVVAAISPTLRNAEIQRAQRAPTNNPQAYDLLLRALSHYRNWTRAGYEEAVRLLRQAITIDPSYALGYAHLSAIFWMMCLTRLGRSRRSHGCRHARSGTDCIDAGWRRSRGSHYGRYCDGLAGRRFQRWYCHGQQGDRAQSK